MTKEPLFIISGEQLDRALAYRVRVLPFMQPNERGEWERFIASCRSRPYNEQEIRQAAINGVLDELEDWRKVNTVEVGDEWDCRTQDVVDSESLMQWISLRKSDLRQQTGQTSAEQQRGRGV